MTKFDPPRYTWSAATAREALTVLEAARDLVESHLSSLEPQDPGKRLAESRRAPVALTVTLDLSGLVQLINDRAAVQHLEEKEGLAADTICWCGREVKAMDDHALCYPGME
ncbi:hypothetical protein ABTY20_19120 [Streptomyces sp. NPDC126497]|uniref:hypothetical protein n=1 Tax=Streptomyces sp. NPDC126497 TaxID=3155313 RepID=UPI00332E2A86